MPETEEQENQLRFTRIPTAPVELKKIALLLKTRPKKEWRALRAEGEARRQAVEEAAAHKANEKNWGVGLNFKANMKLSGGTELINTQIKVGHIPNETSLNASVDAVGKIKRKIDTKHIQTPGVDISFGASMSENRQKKLGMTEGRRAFALKVQ